MLIKEDEQDGKRSKENRGSSRGIGQRRRSDRERVYGSFNKPYTFEGETYDKIDLSGLDNLTAADMIAANKILDRTGSFTFLPEMSLEYACIIAAKATKLPVEFFKGLHLKEAVKVKNRVTAFFYGAE